MSYSKFTNEQLKDMFGIEQRFQAHLFTHLEPRQVSGWLRETLAHGLGFALAQGTEKARSEYIIAPVFLELRIQAADQISVFSGISFNVDKRLKLDGRCDFLVSRSAYQTVLEAPVVVAVEAKQEDFNGGITQCLAEMVAARIFNERKNRPLDRIYGCVTTGDVWRFLVLEGHDAIIEATSFDIMAELEQIFGILWAMTFALDTARP